MNETMNLVVVFGEIWQVITASALFAVAQWFLMLYALVLLADVILLVVLRGVTSNLKTQWYGTERPLVSKSTVQRRFESIMARLDSENPSQYKVAVLEADQLADELLSGSGYAGQNMGERLKGIHPGQIESYEDLLAAHATRNRIVNEQNFALSRAEAQGILEKYRTFFIEMEMLV